MRYLAVGDIHGNYEALLQVLERANFDESKDTLIGIGDYTDGHPDSAEVVEFLNNLTNFVGIRGNHDYWVQDWLIMGVRHPYWEPNGGTKTIESYLVHNPQFMYGKKLGEHQRFFEKLHDYYILKINDKKYGFVHGGWASMKGLGHDISGTYHWDRSLWEHSAMFRNPKAGYPYVSKRWGDLDRAFIGHTSTEADFFDVVGPVYGYEGRLVNIDQGAGWTGKLTLIDIETLEWWQSDFATNFYSKPGR